MAWDLIEPQRGVRRGSHDEVRISVHKHAKSGALELVIVIGAGLVERLKLTKAQPVNLGVGRESTPERGQLAIFPAADGKFRLAASGRNMVVKTRSFHPSLRLSPAAQVQAPLVAALPDKVIVRIPDALLAPRSLSGSLMGDPPVRARA